MKGVNKIISYYRFLDDEILNYYKLESFLIFLLDKIKIITSLLIKNMLDPN